MRVLLIIPYGYQNQGVRLLAAVLRREGFDASVLLLKQWMNNDVQAPTPRELELFDEHLRTARPDLIGFSFGSPYLQVARDLIRRARARTSAFIVSGGVHPTIAPEDCIDDADAVCVGEGEGPLLDLARALSNGAPLSGIANWWLKRDGEIERNPLRPLVANLDELPYTALFDMPVVAIDHDRLIPRDPYKDSAIYRAFASRGCPFRCAYCYNSQYAQLYAGLGRYHRRRGVDSVLAELEVVRSHLRGLGRVHFDDDSFVFPTPWIEEFAAKFPGRIGLPFSVLLNSEIYKETELRRLKEAGLRHVQVGIQSASAEEREQVFQRKGSNETVLGLAHTLRRLGIEVTYDIILDNPLSTPADKQAMIDLLLAMPRPFNLFIYSLTVFPKSALAEKLLSMGVITSDDIEGRATKSWRQFRLSFDYPRSAEDTFYAALISLTSKRLVPRAAIRKLARSRWLRRRPGPVRWMAEAANVVKLAGMAWTMFRRGELSLFKVREYAHWRGRLIQ
jgi:radical SAM superfamily enzyme YgiQ (UPF0313 family)